MTKEPVNKSRSRRKEARPAEIVSAGVAEFAEHGFERARLDRIARAAGISKGTIYLYYPSKEALFLAAAEEHVCGVMGEAESALEGFDGTTEEMLTGLLRNLYSRFTEARAQALIRILVAEGDRIPQVVESYHAMAIDRATALLTRILERGASRGEVARNAILANPHVVIAPAMFFALHNMIFRDVKELDFEGYFQAHAQMVLGGVRWQG